MDVKDTTCDIVDFIHFAPHAVQWWALVNAVLNLWVLQKVRKLMTK
jgi:hypothetical protein